MSFVSPFNDLTSWQWTTEKLMLPSGLRYARYTVRSLHGQRAGAAELRAPCSSAVRHVSVSASSEPGFEVLQLSPLAHRFRELAQTITPGLPTFYFLLPPGTVPLVADQQVVSFDETLATVDDAHFVIVFSDRLPREPAFSVNLLLSAITDALGPLDDTGWRPFRDAVQAATAAGDDAPVLLMDHSGQPLTSGAFNVTVDGQQHQVTLTEEDCGDLQAAIAREKSVANISIPNLWGRGATSARIEAGASIQFARVEDGLHNARSIAISKSERHIMITDLNDWFAPQFAIPTGDQIPSLARFTPGNHIRPLVNGKETFANIFAELDLARGVENGALHLAAGYSMFADTQLTERPEGAPADFPVTLVEAAELLSTRGGSRYLAVDFITVSDPSTLTSIQVLAVLLLVMGQLGTQISPTRNGGAVFLALAVWIANPFIIDWLVQNDFRQLEPNQDGVDTLNAINNTVALLSQVPTTVDDNPLADISNILHGASEPVFDAIRHFSIYHQKIAVIRNANDFIGYCGGIDFNPNRIDDERHLNLSPYHDVHARLEGPAVRDLIVTLNERWERDSTDAPAFRPEDANNIPINLDDDDDVVVVQVARTYGTAVDNARRLEFAPAGDRTLLDTTLRAIAQAREYIYIEDQYLTPPWEYVDALVAKIESGHLKKLIVVIPNVGDQPFGDIRKSEVIASLRAAASAAGDPNIVRVGSPRRHFTTPTSDLLASSGRLILKEDVTPDSMTISLGPPLRLPPVPFWVAVDGELIWVYDESELFNPDPENMKIFKVDRGDETRIISGIAPGKGAHVRRHEFGSAATLVNLDGIYVHAKLMLIDDVFMSIGSANLNRRGFYSDGECNLYSVPEGLRTMNSNPVRALRKRLWAEMLDLPMSIADTLLEDPIDSASLFDRSYFLGNRFVRSEAFPKHVMLHNFAGGDGLMFTVLNHLGFAMTLGSEVPLFNTVIDPTNDLDPDV